MSKPTPRWPAIALILLIAGGLIAWEFFGAQRAADRGVREAAVVLTQDGPFPAVLYVEEGVQYRIAVTSIAGEHMLTGVVAADDGAASGQGSSAPPNVVVRPGEVVWLEAAPETLRDGIRIGGIGPRIQRVDDLATLAAQGGVYELALIADADGMIPRQVRLAEEARVLVGGVSLDGPRMIHLTGTNVRLALWPEELLDRSFDTPRAGTYDIVCEQGCDDERWAGSFRVEAADLSVPWVEPKDTDAAAELNQVAPDFAVYDLQGRVVQLSDFRGEKPVFINFWATWCPPCEREMPDMQRLYAERGDEFELLAVNFLEHRPQVTPWVEEKGLEFPILLDVTGDVSSRYGVWSYPTSVFIDKDGIVRGRFVGELSYGIMEDFIDRISEYKPDDA